MGAFAILSNFLASGFLKVAVKSRSVIQRYNSCILDKKYVATWRNDRQTDRQTDVQTDRKTDRKTDRVGDRNK